MATERTATPVPRAWTLLRNEFVWAPGEGPERSVSLGPSGIRIKGAAQSLQFGDMPHGRSGRGSAADQADVMGRRTQHLGV